MIKIFRRRRNRPIPDYQYQTEAMRQMLVEGRRMCGGCFLWFAPTGTEDKCEACTAAPESGTK